MDDNQHAENTVDVRTIIAEVLDAVGMNAPKFAEAIGINYQRVFDLQRGRTKKFNPSVANLICDRFPQINKTYLYTGEGPVLNPKVEDPDHPASTSMLSEVSTLLNRVVDLFNQVNERSQQLMERERELNQLEIELIHREREVEKREREAGIQKAATA